MICHVISAESIFVSKKLKKYAQSGDNVRSSFESLFCQCSSLLLSIADDEEFFEREHPFTIEGIVSHAVWAIQP